MHISQSSRSSQTVHPTRPGLAFSLLGVGALLFAAAVFVPETSFAQQGQDKAAAAKPMETAAPKTYTIAGEALRAYQNGQTNLAEAADRMPEQHFGFKPVPEVKSFGQHIAHIALSQYGLCSRLKGEDNPKKDEKEEATRSKADAVALLKASTAYCEPLVAGITEASTTEMIPMGKDKVQRGLIPLALVTHADEVYGSMAVYLRLKGILPPSTEKMNKMKEEQSKKSSSQ